MAGESSFSESASRRILLCVLFFLSLAGLTIMLLRNIGSLVLLQYTTHALGASQATPEALNPQLTNTIPDTGGPILYYNGSGPVPPSIIRHPAPSCIANEGQIQWDLANPSSLHTTEPVCLLLATQDYSANMSTEPVKRKTTSTIRLLQLWPMAATTQPSAINALPQPTSCTKLQFPSPSRSSPICSSAYVCPLCLTMLMARLFVDCRKAISRISASTLRHVKPNSPVLAELDLTGLNCKDLPSVDYCH